MTPPFFSILLPVHNAGPHLLRVLQDLQAQTFRNFEIIAVDDGSTDGSGDLLERFDDKRLRVIRFHRNRGLVAALNAGLASARGEWIARQDADDRCGLDRMEHQRALIMATPDAVLFYSRARLIDERGWWRGSMRPPLNDVCLRWDLCFRNAVPHTSVVFPAGLVRDELNGYSGDNVTADFDLWSRLLRRGKAAGDPRRLVSYRNHSASIMGRENRSRGKTSNAGLKMILVSNLVDWAGATVEEAGLLADAWLSPMDADWDRYFSLRESLLAIRSDISVSLIAEEDYTLLHRAAAVSRECASGMIRAMRGKVPLRYASLPQPRTLMFRIMGGV
jgi:glycosyltransferase involved in cell wall biosynthesis